MKIVHSWLNELVPVGDDIDTIAATLTDLGLTVDDILTVGGTVDGVVTARVLRTERHPDAAKVHRVFVDAGDGRARHVWCGAFNMAAGDVVPLATPGTVMPDGRAIEPKPILGIQSDGMLCSAAELGLGNDHSGILLLPADTPLGVPYGYAMGLATETVYDVDVSRNRPDALGVRGVARDLAARMNLPLARASAPVVATGAPRSAPVELVDGDRCARFTSVVISGVRVQPHSPDFIVSRLSAAGMRSINNVVDVSNYVMLELNQPNHAYDLDTLGGGGFRVRLAAAGESMVTLDGVERRLTGEDLLICDALDQPIGVAGVMGGLHSEITDATTVIALETAWFEPLGIAHTVNRLGLRSEASVRFDRGVDTHGMDASMARFAELLSLTCPDLVVHQGIVDARSEHLPAPPTVTLRPNRCTDVLGAELTGDEIAHHLRSIGFAVAAGDTLAVTVPTWRPDCTEEIDLIEEVGRMHGYSRIPKAVPKGAVHGTLSPLQMRRRRLRDVLAGLGVSEAMPNPFLADHDLVRAGLPGDVVRIVNSLVADESVLRTSLRPGLLKAVAFNESHRRVGVSLFEIGHVYPPSSGELPDEFDALAVVLAGRDAPAAVAVWREIAAAMGLGARVDQSVVPAGLHPTRSATLSMGKDVVGTVGEVHPDVLEAFDIQQRVAVLELHLDRLLANEPKVPMCKPTSRFPSSDVDFAFVVADSVAAEKVDKAIRQGAAALLVDVQLFDVYRGPGVPEGSRSLAYRVRLQAADHTLDDAELAAARDRVIQAAAKLGATLRS
jgi:phenylalanyl-tRNA synthetase beta chain